MQVTGAKILTPYMTQKPRCGVVMVVDDEFKSQPCTCITIYYTYNETLKGLRCYELPKLLQTHSILVWNVDKGQADFDPTNDWETCCGHHFRAQYTNLHL